MKIQTRNIIFNFLKTPLLLVLVLLACWFAITKTGLPQAFGNWFKKKPLIIDNTPLVITQVKNIAELQTAQLYAELVVDSTVYTNMDMTNSALKSIGMPTLPVGEQRKIVLIVKGKVIAGIDLKQLTDDRVFVKMDSVSILLPPAIILGVITNPSDFETFIETGTWTDTEVRAVKNKAQRLLLQKAAQQQLVKKANEQAAAAVEQIMRSLGFNRLHVQTQ
jgi:hypothetical protein